MGVYNPGTIGDDSACAKVGLVEISCVGGMPALTSDCAGNGINESGGGIGKSDNITSGVSALESIQNGFSS